MSGTRILVIDDEQAIRRLLKISFEAEGYTVVDASNGKDGLVAVPKHRPEIIILDLGLPDMDGLAVLQQLREWSTVPVIVLTVRDSDADKVALLDAGADDYLTKPFSVPELLARIRTALRHRNTPANEPIFVSGDFEIDFTEHQVRLSGEVVKLTITEFEILRLLGLHAGKIVTQKQLLKEIWGPHAVEETQYLRVYIAQLRKKLERDSSQPQRILTEPGVGYRLKI